jgi:peptidoglycan/LPS O-acetylase OafA/YrhL
VHLIIQKYPNSLPELVIKIEQVSWQYFVFYLPWFLVGAAIWLIFNSANHYTSVKLNVLVIIFSVLFIEYFVIQDSEKYSAYIFKITTIFLPIFLVALFVLGANDKTRLRTPLHSQYMIQLGSISFEFYLIHEFLGNTIVGLLIHTLGELMFSSVFWIFSIICIWFLTIGTSRFIKSRVSDKFRT